MIVREAKKKLPPEDYDTLKAINKLIMVAIRNKNIVVHGVIHAKVVLETPLAVGTKLPINPATPHNFASVPCWTIFMGEDAGKSFTVSKNSVIIIKENVRKIINKVQIFNDSHKYIEMTKLADAIEEGWPNLYLCYEIFNT